RRLDLRLGAGDAPDPRLVENALEEAGCDAGGVHRGSDSGVLDRVGARRLRDRERSVERTVEVEPPRAVIGRGDVVPSIARHDSRTLDRMGETKQEGPARA